MQKELTPTIADMSEVQKKTMQTKTFSVKDGSIVVENGNIDLYKDGYRATTEKINRKLYSNSLYQLPLHPYPQAKD